VVEQLNALSAADLHEILSPLGLRAIFLVERFRTPAEALQATPAKVAASVVRLPEFVVERRNSPAPGQEDVLAVLDLIAKHYGIEGWIPSKALAFSDFISFDVVLSHELANALRWNDLSQELFSLDHRREAARTVITAALTDAQVAALTAYREQLVADANAKRCGR
jgi:hypothetical protein